MEEEEAARRAAEKSMQEVVGVGRKVYELKQIKSLQLYRNKKFVKNLVVAN